MIALTMIDVAEKQSLEIDTKKLSKLLQIPVVEVKATQKLGIDELAAKVLETAYNKSVLDGNSFFDRNSADDLDFIRLSLQDDGEVNKKIFARYNFISDVYQESVKPKQTNERSFSEKIDRVLTHKFFGLLILVAILLFVFQTIFFVGKLADGFARKRFRRVRGFCSRQFIGRHF